MGFVCSICGQEHSGLPTDQAFTLPDDVWAIPEQERSEAARFTNDLCQFGDRYFIRGVLEVPFKKSDNFFGWGVWAEVEWPVFERYLEMYEKDGFSEPRHNGVLANNLRAYPESLGLPVLIQFRESTKRPSFHMADDNSAVFNEQHDGIDDARYHEILETL